MADTLSQKMERWGLSSNGVGIHYCYDTRFADDGPVVAYTGEAWRKGYVMLCPVDPRSVFAPTLDEALEKLSVLALYPR